MGFNAQATLRKALRDTASSYSTSPHEPAHNTNHMADRLTEGQIAEFKEAYSADTASTRPLFGGALTLDVPSTWTDASTLRELPDHQEVFVDNESLRSIIVEILQHVPAAATGKFDTPAGYFFHDLAEANEAAEGGGGASPSPRVERVLDIDCPGVDGAGGSGGSGGGKTELHSLVGRQFVAKFKEVTRDEVLVFLLNVRYVGAHMAGITCGVVCVLCVWFEYPSARPGRPLAPHLYGARI